MHYSKYSRAPWCFSHMKCSFLNFFYFLLLAVRETEISIDQYECTGVVDIADHRVNEVTHVCYKLHLKVNKKLFF